MHFQDLRVSKTPKVLDARVLDQRLLSKQLINASDTASIPTNNDLVRHLTGLTRTVVAYQRDVPTHRFRTEDELYQTRLAHRRP